CVAPIAGRVSGTILTKVADLAEAAGSDRIGFTPYQKLVILDVPDDKLHELVAGLDALGLPSRPSAWRKNLMACTGIEYCKLSFAETRNRAQVLVPELEKRLGDVNAPLGVPVPRHIKRPAGRADHRQHQRLPELVRPHPGRRHWVQGSDGRRR